MKLPATGQIARVRTRHWLVGAVEPSAHGTLVDLSCVDDDAQGEPLQVVWEVELDAVVLDSEACEKIDRPEPLRWIASHRLLTNENNVGPMKVWPDHSSPGSLLILDEAIDGRTVLITSANFTEAAQRRNIEVGIILRSPLRTQQLTRYFAGLRESASLKPLS
jgi:hypothetical protein